MPPAALWVDPRTMHVFLLLLVYLYSINTGWALQEAQPGDSGWKRCLCCLPLDVCAGTVDFVTMLCMWWCKSSTPLVPTAAVGCDSSCGQGPAVSPGRTAAVGVCQPRWAFELSMVWEDQRLYCAVWAEDGVRQLNSGVFLIWKNTGCLLKWRFPASVLM